jgi:hypothetical protein
VAAWAQAQPDVRALVQIGSRVQPGARPDAWSDFDYQLITTRPERYRDGAFARGLGDCWAHGVEASFGSVLKVKAVYAGALEADFVILRHLEVRLALLALRWPAAARCWPRRLAEGVQSLRIVAGPGWKVIKGGPAWERRYGRLSALRPDLTAGEFGRLCGRFWSQAAWAAKKAQRGEFLASQRALHLCLLEDYFRLCEAAARAAGRPAWPEARRAEQWLGESRLAGVQAGSAPDRASLLRALHLIADGFAATAAELAEARQWPRPDYGAVRTWLAGLGAGAPAP